MLELRVLLRCTRELRRVKHAFSDHNCKLFEKNGMANIGYWHDVTKTENKLIYILADPQP